MAIGMITDKEPAELAFQKINAAINKVNSIDSRVTQVEALAGDVLIKRTISNEAPNTIPADGDEWLVV